MKYLQKCNGDIGKETCRDEGGILLSVFVCQGEWNQLSDKW